MYSTLISDTTMTENGFWGPHSLPRGWNSLERTSSHQHRLFSGPLTALRADDLPRPSLVFCPWVQVCDLHLHRLHLQILGWDPAHLICDLVSLDRNVLPLDAEREIRPHCEEFMLFGIWGGRGSAANWGGGVQPTFLSTSVYLDAEIKATHSEIWTKMSSPPLEGRTKPWPCDREKFLHTPLNTGPEWARTVLQTGTEESGGSYRKEEDSLRTACC